MMEIDTKQPGRLWYVPAIDDVSFIYFLPIIPFYI